jgi:hypothetical protein
MTNVSIPLLLGTVYASAVILNFPWEMAQAPLYEPMGTLWEATRRCFSASLGDGVMVVLVVLAGKVAFRSITWFVDRSPKRVLFASIAGMALSVLVELWGLHTHRWAYLPAMPLLPATRIGVVPITQMAVLAPMSLQLARMLLARGALVSKF